MPKWPRALLLGGLLLSASALLEGCKTTPQPTPTIATTKPDCTLWRALTYTAKGDSAETVREIVEANAVRAAVCGQ